MRKSSLNRWMLFAVVLVGLAGSARAATIATFDVSVAASVAATANGTANSAADPGNVATLEDLYVADDPNLGKVTITYKANSTNSYSSDTTWQTIEVYGSFTGGNTLAVTSARSMVTSCVHNSGWINGCSYVTLNTWDEWERVNSSTDGVFNPVAFVVLPVGTTTTFTGRNALGSGISASTTTYTIHLTSTSVPEPGSAMLMLVGAAGLTARRLRRG